MSKKTLFALVTVVAVAAPSPAAAQIGIAARAGTLGLGGEAAVALGKMLQVRGGIGSTKYHYDGTFSDKKYTVDFPNSIWNVGVDLFPFGGGFHLSAGMLNRPKFDMTGTYTGSTQVGNTTYSGTVHIVGNMTNSKETGPYAGIGFGRTSKHGFGITFDLGAAQLGDGVITFTSGTCTQSSGQPCPQQPSTADLNAEAAKANNDVGGVLKWHPILSLGLHYGLGK